MKKDLVDVCIVGGGPAGLSSALTLARGGRSVAVCDDGRPRNIRASFMNNFPGMDGINPLEFLKRIKKDLRYYPEIHFINNSVIDVKKSADHFVTEIFDGEIIKSKKVLLAEGGVDLLPDIPGIQEGWGRSIFHCPFCHGYELSDQGIGILADRETLFHTLTLLLGLNSDIIVFLNGQDFLTSKEREVLHYKNVLVVNDPIAGLVFEEDQLRLIKLKSGDQIERDALFIRPMNQLRSPLAIRLGCKVTDEGTIETDECGKTSVHGLYVAGDQGSRDHSVLLACASGSKAGMNLNVEILEEDFYSTLPHLLEAPLENALKF